MKNMKVKLKVQQYKIVLFNLKLFFPARISCLLPLFLKTKELYNILKCIYINKNIIYILISIKAMIIKNKTINII